MGISRWMPWLLTAQAKVHNRRTTRNIRKHLSRLEEVRSLTFRLGERKSACYINGDLGKKTTHVSFKAA